MSRQRPAGTVLRDRIPLSLYVHVPWCVRKCPYCDFNSHAVRGPIDEDRFVVALLADLRQDLVDHADTRPLQSIFVGGGTPSLLSADAVARLLDGIGTQCALMPDIEITLEANPGTAEAARFAGLRAAGVNRLSLGIQSLDDRRLRQLGRVHDADEALAAVAMARDAGFDNFNLDLMYGLPGQDADGAADDLARALSLAPPHLSWYQLTIEPNTLFAARPPRLPADGTIAAIEAAGRRLLRAAGLEQYEVSAWARPGRACRHNLNYWRFGDYLGIGPGAHSKLTGADGVIMRRDKERHPATYLDVAATPQRVRGHRELASDELGIEFMMNALRLVGGVPEPEFRARTGADLSLIDAPLADARSRGLLDDDRLRATALGRRFLDDLVALFA